MGDEIILENVVKDAVETFEIQTSDGYCVHVVKRHIFDFKLEVKIMPVVASKRCEISTMESVNPKMIDCQNCDGIAFLKFITYITYNIYGKQLSIYNTPVLVCNNCNEQYISAKIAERIQDFEKSSFIELDFYF